MLQSYPLDWPQGYPRYPYHRQKARFKSPSLHIATQSILEQVRLLKGKYRLAEGDCIISSNVPLRNDGLPRADYMRSVINDVGVAVYFEHNKDKVVLCCDRWNSVEQNMKAIAITIEDIRRIERNGVSDFIKRSFTGFKALPQSNNTSPWWVVLGFGLDRPENDFKNPTVALRLYRDKAKANHPDNGGSVEGFQELQNAWQEAKKYFNIQ